jgi:hypothetical protein
MALRIDAGAWRARAFRNSIRFDETGNAVTRRIFVQASRNLLAIVPVRKKTACQWHGNAPATGASQAG